MSYNPVTIKFQSNKTYTIKQEVRIMTKQDAIKKIWNLVEIDKIREAEELARKYNVEMYFDDNCIGIEDDVFYFNGR